MQRMTIDSIRNFSSRSPSPRRPRRSPPRNTNNDVHRENPVPSSVLGVFGLSQRTTEQDLKGKKQDIGIKIDI